MSERPIAAIAIVAAPILFLILLALSGSAFESFDEAKYVGLGRSLFAGQGYATVFGTAFFTHPPGWPLLLTAPEAVFGMDAFTWGRLVNALSGAGLIAMAGWIGWRVRPAVGALAAVALLAQPYLADLSRTARLDVPGAAVTVLATMIGVIAVERGSSRGGLISGALFAIAFLIKETSLVMLAAPAAAGLIGRQRPATIARVNAWIVLVLAIGSAWWFAFVATETGLVYRTALPGWMLIPGAFVLALAIGAGLAAERLVARSERADAGAGFSAARGRPVALGIALAAAWAGVLLIVLARSPELGGSGLFDRTQILAWLRFWLPKMRAPLLFVVGGAVALAAVMVMDQFARRRPGNADRSVASPVGIRATAVLVPTLFASLPLVLFVAATGEPPRNDFAPLVFGAVLGAAGWIAIVDRLRVARSLLLATAGGLIVGVVGGLAVAALNGLPSFRVAALGGGIVGGGWAVLGWVARRRVEQRAAPSDRSGAAPSEVLEPVDAPGRLGWPVRQAIPLAIVGALIVSTGALAIHVRRTPGTAATAPRAIAVRTITAWVRAHEPKGTSIAVGSLLGNEVAIELGGYHVAKMSAVQAGVAAGAPLGLTIRPGDQVDDWLSIDLHPRKTDQFLVFGATATVAALRTAGAPIWIYVTGETTAAPTIVGALTPANGFTVIEHWTWPSGRGALEGWVFGIDEANLGFANAPIRIEPAALVRLVTLVARLPDSTAIASRLAGRVLVTPDGAAARSAKDALAALAAGR